MVCFSVGTFRYSFKKGACTCAEVPRPAICQCYFERDAKVGSWVLLHSVAARQLRKARCSTALSGDGTTVFILWSCYIKDTLREEKHQIFNFLENIAIVQYLMKLYIARWNVVFTVLDLNNVIRFFGFTSVMLRKESRLLSLMN